MFRLALLLLLAAPAVGMTAEGRLRANPIRKVVTLLQDMQKSVEAEGTKEKELYDKFMCSCETQGASLEENIAMSGQKVAELESKVKSNTAVKAQLGQDIVGHKADRDEAQKTVKESTAMRNKEAGEFAETSGEMKANIQAMGGALAALKKGLSASLLQTSTGDLLRHIVSDSPAVSDEMRGPLLAFLNGGASDSEEAEGSSDQIVGIVQQMQETMVSDLKDAAASEAEAKSSFNALMEAKNKEITAAVTASESKTQKLGGVAVAIVQGKADLQGTSEAMQEDVKFKGNLGKSCAKKTKEFDERSKVQAEEMQAISETVEMLNSDDALELFKKQQEKTSFLQTASSSSSKARQHKASSLLQNVLAGASPKHLVTVKMMLLALKGKSRSGRAFKKVAEMIDNMVAVLHKEEEDDMHKKDFCLAEIAKTQDEKKGLQNVLADLEATIDEMADGVNGLQSEIDGLQQGLADLDKQAALATKQRKAEHQEYMSTSAASQATLDLLNMARNRMNKFYNPDQYDQALAPTTPEPESFVQVSARRSAVDDSLAALGGGQDRKQESGGVIALMSHLIKEVELDMQEAKMEEATAQKDYEDSMASAATKRTDDTKLMVTKGEEKAEGASRLEDEREAQMTKNDQHHNSEQTLMDLHRSCDSLLKNFDARKEERAKEIEGLMESKGVLAASGSSFLQRK